MSLGLGASLSKPRLVTPGIVSSSLILKHKYESASVIPISDGAAYFDGSNDYVDLGTNFESTLLNSDFSVSVWVKATDGNPSSAEYFIGTKDGNDNFWLRVETDGDVQFYYKEGTTESNLIASGYFANGASDWVNLVFTLSNSAQKIYANGVVIASGTVSLDSSGFAQDTNRNLVIGGRNNAGTIDGFFNGYICNVGVWSTVLTQSQIKSIMNKRYTDLTSSETTNLVSWWSLDSTARDSFGSNHGTLT